MYPIIKKLLFILLFFLMSKPSYAVFAGKVIIMEHRWPENILFDKFSFTQQITHDGGPDSIYFWGNHFQFENGRSGYIGLFNRDRHTIHFSIRNATSWKSGKCKHFTQEGSGVRCEIDFPWKIGIRYKLDVSKNGNLVTGSVTNLISGEKTTVGTIEVPSKFGKLHKSYGFVEDHSRWKRHLSSCYVLSPQSSTFFSPRAVQKNIEYEANLSASTQGKCTDPYIIQTACTFSFCMNSISDLGGLASPSAGPEISISNGKDLSAQTIFDVLKKKELVVIRSKDRSWAPNIFLPSPTSFKWKSIFIDHQATSSSTLHTNHTTQKLKTGQKIMYMSDGKIWKIMKTN
ncbi:hypothetical protein GGR08_000521 [Bartonella fuyuanensis]|uniref:Metalloprotease StcE beta-sandwich domain-containing protein n=1 Tax=Bartonella fuyuanensis TaxID=1460968 RepID=A0A840E218_9HYPH|nr:DUF3472 domain-containing protein [Bartonella fuyuanensis]MBB4076228.1 hypothetical protein [Bartonella fuyuanensis]